MPIRLVRRRDGEEGRGALNECYVSKESLPKVSSLLAKIGGDWSNLSPS